MGRDGAYLHDPALSFPQAFLRTSACGALFALAGFCMDLVRVRLSRERKLPLWYTGSYLVAWCCVSAAFPTIGEWLAKT
jgi:hypothetical protein